MSSPTLAIPEPDSEQEYNVILTALLAEMSRMNEKTSDNQAEIERLNAEIRQIQAQTQSVKTRLSARLDALASMEFA